MSVTLAGPDAVAVGASRRWLMLALGLYAQISRAVFLFCAAFLIPAFQRERDVSLAYAGLFVAMPTVGLVLTSIGWGVLVDRHGERAILATGSTVTAVSGFIAAAADIPVALAAALLVGVPERRARTARPVG